MALPGWNSPILVKEIHDFLEGGALLFFAALVVFDVLAHFKTKRERIFEKISLICFAVAVIAEICAYPYSRRNDELAADALARSQREIARIGLEASKNELEAGEAREAAAKASARAGLANEKAGDANRRAEKLARENIRLRGEFGKANADAKVREEQLRHENLTTETKLESERTTRLELEKSLAPRILGFQIGPGNRTSFDELKPFAGTGVIFDVLLDAEAQRTAQEIGNVLQAAGWKILQTNIRPDLYIGYFDGVMIEPMRPSLGPLSSLPPPSDVLAQKAAEQRSIDCAETLELFLLSKDWRVRVYSWHEDKIPPNAIKIIVGFKPSPYFDPAWVKEMQERYKKLKKELQERRMRLPRLPTPQN